MKTKIIVLLSVLIFALGMFIACGDPTTSETAGETVSSTETATDTETGTETGSETGSTGSESTSETHTHSYGVFVEWVNEPTLTEAGKAKMKCECDEVTKEDVPALGDATVWTKGADVADPCVGGEAEYTSEKYPAVKVQVAPKHQFGELVPAKAPTCSAEGNIEYKQCSVCHKYFNADETPVTGDAVTIPVDPNNHAPAEAVKENAVEATCIVAGSYDSVVRCKDCNAVISTNHVTGELGDHNFESGACSVCKLAEKYSGAMVNLYGVLGLYKSVMTFDKKGVADDKAIKYDSSYYSNATLTFEWVDYAAGKIKFVSKYKNASSESGWGGDEYALNADDDGDFNQAVYYGYIDKTTGVIVVGTNENNEKIGTGNYVFIPSDENIEESAIVSSGAGNSAPKAMTFTLKNGATTSVIIYDGKVEFGVTFADISGNALVASALKEMKNLADGFTFVAKKDGEDVVAYGVKDGSFIKLGSYYGVYEGSAEGDPVLTINGMGEAKLGEKVGSYVVNGEKVELSFVDGDGLVCEFYNVTFADGKYTAEKPESEVSFNVGEGHDGKDSVTVNTFTAFRLTDHKLADTETHLFKGWKLNGELITEDYVIVEGDIELVAVWAAKITVTLEDEKIEGGTKTITVGVGDGMLAALPDKSDDDTFDGYYIVVDGEEIKLEQGDTFEDGDDGSTIKAKYIKFPVEADIGNGNGVEGIDVPKGVVVAEYINEKLAEKLAVKDGYKFDGWYLDADFATELATDAVASKDIVNVYGKWSWAGNVEFTTANDEYTFVYDVQNGWWKSNNNGVKGKNAKMEFKVTSGVAEISFEYKFDRKDDCKLQIYYGPEWVSVSKTASVDWTTLTTTIDVAEVESESNRRIQIGCNYSYSSWAVQGTVYIRNLKINGVTTFAQAPLNPDMAGTFTATDGTVVKTTAGGGVTVGDETVPYTAVSENVIGVTLNVGYREITLNKADHTCAIVTPQVKITYNYGGHGGTDVTTDVDKNSTQTVLADAPVADGFKFRGWYKDATFTDKAEAGSSFVAGADITFYAKWDEKVTLKFDYNGQGTATVEVNDKYVGDNVSEIPEVAADVKFGEKVFAGWFIKNDDGSFGAEASTSVVLEGDTTYYAKWVEPSPFYGSYTVVKVNSSGSVDLYNTTTTKIDIDIFGNATIGGWNGFSYGSKISVAFAEGSDSIVTITQTTSYNTSKYYGIFDATTKIIVRANGTSNLSTGDMYFMIPYAGYVKNDFGAYAFYDGSVYHKVLAYEDKNNVGVKYTIYTENDAVYPNASFKDFDGNAIAVADLKNALNIFVYNGETVVKEFAKNSSGSFVTAIDEFKGYYSDINEELDVLFFNGAGVAKLGDKVGTYKLKDDTENEFDVYLDNNSVYYEAELIVDGETHAFMATKPTVKVTYDLKGHGENDVVEGLNKNVKYTLKTDKPADEGYKFWGWFEDEELTVAANSSYTLTADKTFYAKWTAKVTLKFDYNGQGTVAVEVADKYVGDKVSGIPAVAADVKFGEKVFAGWFIKNDDGSFGAEASTSTVLEGDTTYYAKWVDAPQSVGTFKGWNMDDATESGTKTSFSSEYFKVEVNGAYKHDNGSGVLTDEQAAITDGYMVLNDCYIYFNKELGLVWRAWGKNEKGVGNDTRIGVNVDLVKSLTYSGFKGDEGSYIAYFEITYKDNTVKTAFLYNSKIVANATWGDGVSAIDANKADRTVSVNGVAIAKVAGKKILGNDGLAGTYTGDYGEIVVNGFGNVTVGGATVDYTIIAERTIKFVAANSMKEVLVDLGNETYTKVQDGYQGTYTLPDNSTVTLDGFGGAGEGKTYVVNGRNITIFDGETSTNYGIDVENKVFLAKSKFANERYVHEKNSYAYITFDDDVEIKGTLGVGTYGYTITFANGVLNGNELTVKVVAQAGNVISVGDEIVLTIVDKQTVTIKSGNFKNLEYTFVGFVLNYVA